MKKVSLIVLALVLMSTSAFALTVAPKASVNFYDEAKTAVGIGLEADYQTPLLAKEFVSATSLEYAGTILDKSDIDLNIVKLSQEFGYEYDFDAKLSVTPSIGIDGYAIDAQGANKADNTVGMSLGAKTTYKVNENLAVSGIAKYSWATAQVNDADVCLDGFTLGASVAYKF